MTKKRCTKGGGPQQKIEKLKKHTILRGNVFCLVAFLP